MFEFSELLVDKLGVTDVGASFPHTVTLHTSCHSLRSLHLTDQPARLLAAVRGLDFVALPHNDECCGFGGTFAVKNADVSTAMGNDKVANIAATQRRRVRRGRQLLPDADRRPAAPARRRRSAACTWPRFWRASIFRLKPEATRTYSVASGFSRKDPPR